MCICIHYAIWATCTPLGVALGPGTVATPRPLSEQGIAAVKESVAAASASVWVVLSKSHEILREPIILGLSPPTVVGNVWKEDYMDMYILYCMWMHHATCLYGDVPLHPHTDLLVLVLVIFMSTLEKTVLALHRKYDWICACICINLVMYIHVHVHPISVFL